MSRGLQCPGEPPQQRTAWPPVSVVPSLRDDELRIKLDTERRGGGRQSGESGVWVLSANAGQGKEEEGMKEYLARKEGGGTQIVPRVSHTPEGGMKRSVSFP